ncbi:MAG: hypothetical protein JSV86_07385, partial [Gemmatimonadota bacterium]
RVGDKVIATGSWVEHQKYGVQLQIIAVTVKPPSTVDGALRWLAMFLPHLGEVRAAALANALPGQRLWDTLAAGDVDTLTQVPGITPARATEIVDTFTLVQSSRELITWLLDLGLTDAVVRKAMARWGANARARITEDPYILCELEGVGFATADVRQLRTKLDIADTDERRLRAALHEALQQLCFSEGHTWITEAKAVEAAHKLTRTRQSTFRPVLDDAERFARHAGLISTAALAAAEREIALTLKRRI